MDKRTKVIIQKLLGIPPSEGIGEEEFVNAWRLRIGRHIYKKKYTARDVVEAMKKCGLREGAVVFVQSRWAEFYNCTSTPAELIDEILKVLGPTGTLAMACIPYMREGKMFNVKRTPTNTGLLSEVFRKYPGVKRSIHLTQSVCAIGPKADYLISEHHLGETPWDKKSPYYRIYELNGLQFGLGLGKYYQGTISHCIDSLLKDEIPYYHDMFNTVKSDFHYIDYDGQEKIYQNYAMFKTGPKRRMGSYVLYTRISKKYLKGSFQQISNLQINCYNAKDEVDTLLSLARKGIDSYWTPSKKGYKFEK